MANTRQVVGLAGQLERMKGLGSATDNQTKAENLRQKKLTREYVEEDRPRDVESKQLDIYKKAMEIKKAEQEMAIKQQKLAIEKKKFEDGQNELKSRNLIPLDDKEKGVSVLAAMEQAGQRNAEPSQGLKDEKSKTAQIVDSVANHGKSNGSRRQKIIKTGDIYDPKWKYEEPHENTEADNQRHWNLAKDIAKKDMIRKLQEADGGKHGDIIAQMANQIEPDEKMIRKYLPTAISISGGDTSTVQGEPLSEQEMAYYFSDYNERVSDKQAKEKADAETKRRSEEKYELERMKPTRTAISEIQKAINSGKIKTLEDIYDQIDRSASFLQDGGVDIEYVKSHFKKVVPTDENPRRFGEVWQRNEGERTINGERQKKVNGKWVKK